MKVTKENLPGVANFPVYCVEGGPVEGADGVGECGENGKAEWFFRFSYSNRSAAVYAWVFLAESEDHVELVVDESDGLTDGVARYYENIAKNVFLQAKFVREQLPDAIRSYRERMAEAA